MKNTDDSLSSQNKIKKVKKSKWIYYIFIITFVLSISFGSISSVLIGKLNIFVALLLLVIIIALGIVFDMIGMSVVTCKEATFHAKASKKQKGAKEAVKLVKASDKVSSVCNDVIGDVCGVISGAVSAMLAIKIASVLSFSSSIISLILGAIVASFTVGGKAIEKTIIVKHADKVIFTVGKIIYYITPRKISRKNSHK